MMMLMSNPSAWFKNIGGLSVLPTLVLAFLSLWPATSKIFCVRCSKLSGTIPSWGTTPKGFHSLRLKEHSEMRRMHFMKPSIKKLTCNPVRTNASIISTHMVHKMNVKEIKAHIVPQRNEESCKEFMRSDCCKCFLIGILIIVPFWPVESCTKCALMLKCCFYKREQWIGTSTLFRRASLFTEMGFGFLQQLHMPEINLIPRGKSSQTAGSTILDISQLPLCLSSLSIAIGMSKGIFS